MRQVNIFVSSVLLSVFSVPAVAQTVETFTYPKFLCWSSLIPTGWDNSDPYVRQTIYVEAYNSNTHSARPAATVAQEAAAAIVAYRGNHTSADRPICVFIKNFGRDELEHDWATDGTPRHWDYPLRFFRFEDRLPDFITGQPRVDDDLLTQSSLPESS